MEINSHCLKTIIKGLKIAQLDYIKKSFKLCINKWHNIKNGRLRFTESKTKHTDWNYIKK